MPAKRYTFATGSIGGPIVSTEFVLATDYDTALATAAHWKEMTEQLQGQCDAEIDLRIAIEGDWRKDRARLAEVTKERDEAFKMSRCECGPDECCANLVKHRERLAEAERLLLSHEVHFMSGTLGAWSGQVALYFHGLTADSAPAILAWGPTAIKDCPKCDNPAACEAKRHCMNWSEVVDVTHQPQQKINAADSAEEGAK